MARAKAVLETIEAPPRRAASTRRASRKPKRARARRDRTAARPLHERTFRQTVRRIDLWSVLKVSVCFFLTGLIVLLVSGMVLWWIASSVGIVESVEGNIGDLISSDDFRFLSWEVLRASTLVGLVAVCLLVTTTVLAAALYNLFSDLLGGVEVTVVEDDPIAR